MHCCDCQAVGRDGEIRSGVRQRVKEAVLASGVTRRIVGGILGAARVCSDRDYCAGFVGWTMILL